jgi:hypothetical protein
MREVLRTHDAGGSIAGMALHDFGAVAIAGYSQSTAKASAFVVDVWHQAGSDWKLAVRYTSSSHPTPPGSVTSPRPVENPEEILIAACASVGCADRALSSREVCTLEVSA